MSRMDEAFEDYLEGMNNSRRVELCKQFFDDNPRDTGMLFDNETFLNWLRSEFEGTIEARRVEHDDLEG